ncbi:MULTISPECIES: PEP/pyruvate-binding domain-containing protein [unclassified Pseudoalteromonas]|uniref:PEP/pyruvate-binding domain-containing protein n=1 Tax=unclassified Pseudoalteromonas TaxID=194690 RepID=UPI0025B36E20|nr:MULTISPECIES: PEP/pyruvate-binding domain-containing protein [unclassified Pseudoalteromonas]MDN3379173.1 PEP/pyruvate-binding domain-containing protein [Pseudoalteromonas sp. APC 3893]MDN3387668.1 PEP/pyruvate-binding domain-containing protein [Pseudoalteromonas sp. APC 4017]
MSYCISLQSNSSINNAEVGGKAASLIKLHQAGYTMPQGFVLTTNFFDDWYQQIKNHELWIPVNFNQKPLELGDCQSLQNFAKTLDFSAVQQAAINDGLGGIADQSSVTFAVRSSAPVEDQESHSFAGIFESELNVVSADVKDAIRHCFVASLDHRVFSYKHSVGVGIDAIELAVIVQTMIDADCAGVGFSLNPQNNDFDELVIEANWGLGITVVSGDVIPDQYLIEKQTGTVLQRNLGCKSKSVKICTRGGTNEYQDDRVESYVLDSSQLAAIASAIIEVEKLYDRPVDIEWAIAQGKFNLLQARPITSYVPLVSEMQTSPGERRILYMDVALSKGMASNAPMSRMEEHWNAELLERVMRQDLKIAASPKEGIAFVKGARMYLNLSSIMRLTKLKKIAESFASTDVLAADILREIDTKEYKLKMRPKWLKLSLLWKMFRLVWKLKRMIGNIIKALIFPTSQHRHYQQVADDYIKKLTQEVDYSLDIATFRQRYETMMFTHVFEHALAAMSVGIMASSMIKRLVGRRHASLADTMASGFDDNVIVEMGISLSQLASLMDASVTDGQTRLDIEQLKRKVLNRDMPEDFLTVWDVFIKKYWFRGINDMDVASPRYGESPELVLKQLVKTASTHVQPDQAHQQVKQSRLNAYDKLNGDMGWLRRRLLKYAFKLGNLFGGTRETPKHWLVLYKSILRNRVLSIEKQLKQHGKMEDQDTLFDRTLAEVSELESSINLNEAMPEADFSHSIIRGSEQFRHKVRNYPRFIDSRGKILHAASKISDGQLHGRSVSPGVVEGKVKVLATPDEKAFSPGEILVAYATDPCWTFLIMNSKAIVLEVGGVLQHGAIVAREFGKPCVVGVDQASTYLKDGDFIRVDAIQGTVTLLNAS